MAGYSEAEYRRYSAALKEYSRKYAISPIKRPRGQVIIEVVGETCQLQCSVKNLRPLFEDGYAKNYTLWLVDEDDNERFPVYAGEIILNESGVGEGKWKLEANNVNNSGLTIEDFSALEILAGYQSDGSPGETVLIGQLGLEEANLSEKPEMKKVSPFGSEMPEAQWWKFYPGQTQGVMQPSPNFPVNNRGNGVWPAPVFQGHQLVGLQYDQNGAVEYLVHGIPGRFCLRDQPYGGASGYTFWHPLPGQQYKAGDYGYWLIHINPVTGEVVFPKEPTNPPDCDNCTRND